MVSFSREIILRIFSVVRDIFSFLIFRSDFLSVFFFLRVDEIIRIANIVIVMEVIVSEGLIVIEASMELNHSFLGLAGLEDSRKSRTLERWCRFL